MSPRRLAGVLAVALTAAAAALVPTASTAAIPITKVTPITIGSGYNATVTVDGSGTGHIAYLGNEPGENTLHYCKLPRGATACSVQTTLPTAGSTSLEHPLVVVNGNTIQVVSYRYGFTTGSFSQDIVYTSTDGGASFGAGVSVGQNPFYLAIPGPGNTVSTITNADSADGGTIYQRLPLDGSSAGNTRANLSPTHLYEGALALLDPNTPIATMSDASDNAFWRRYTGSGDPNDANNWTPEQPIGSVRGPHFGFGPNGVFLVGGAPTGQLQSRKWNGNGFNGPVTIPGGNGETPQAFATEDPAGRIHVTFPQITANCCKVLYATSDNGTTWAARQFQLGTDLPAQMRVSAALDHVGVAVWHAGSGSSATVYALPIGPSAAVPTVAKYAGATLVSGTVLIKQPGSTGFSQLRGGDVIPVGSVVDATDGRVRITIAVPGGKLESADFYDGVFVLTQAKSGLATMVLTGGSFKSCRGAGRAAQAAKAKVIRHLWGDGAGKFRTKGRFAAATIRGTKWDMTDRCDGTLTSVAKGAVTVTDLKRHKNVVVKKGRSYLAKA